MCVGGGGEGREGGMVVVVRRFNMAKMRENTHLLRGQGFYEHSVQGVDVALNLLEIVDALLLLLLLL